MDKVMSLAINVGFTIIAAGATIICGRNSINDIKDIVCPHKKT